MITNTSTETAIDLAGVSKSFGHHAAVRNFSLKVSKGSTFGFLGSNGAGKTTTLKMLMGLLRPDAGSISVIGMDPVIDGFAVKQRVGYVPEQQFIHRWMRVREVIEFCRSLYPTWDNRLASEFLKLLRLDPRKKVGHLSKGMLVKLSLLLALAHAPQLLILDEPMAGLDPLVRDELLDGVLRSAAQCDRTLVFSSHMMSDVERLADTVGIIHEGQLLVHCRVDDLLTGTKRIRAVLKEGCSPTAAPENTIWQQVQNREWLLTVRDFSDEIPKYVRASSSIESVDVFDLRLEDIFKDYVRGWRALS